MRREHWERVYAATPSSEVSWYTRDAGVSIRLMEAVTPSRSVPVIDVGAGASVLVDRLLEAGFTDVTVLDVSEHALGVTRGRLGERASAVTFIARDVLEWEPDRRYAVGHDRAVFHFLTEPAERDRYVDTLAAAIRPGGSLLVATFAEDGPEQCSGLPVCRYTAEDLASVFAARFSLVASEREEHVTPRGALQPFTWVNLRRD